VSVITSYDVVELIKLADRPDSDTVAIIDRVADLATNAINAAALVVGIAACTVTLMRSHHLVPDVLPNEGFFGMHIEGDESKAEHATAAMRITVAVLNDDKPMAIDLTKAAMSLGPEYCCELIVAALATYRGLHCAAHRRPQQ
jgi:hypothetical protein